MAINVISGKRVGMVSWRESDINVKVESDVFPGIKISCIPHKRFKSLHPG